MSHKTPGKPCNLLRLLIIRLLPIFMLLGNFIALPVQINKGQQKARRIHSVVGTLYNTTAHRLMSQAWWFNQVCKLATDIYFLSTKIVWHSITI